MSKLDYSRLFIDNLKLWGFWTAVSQFVIFLLSFILLCAAFGFMTMSDESELPDDFISKFELNLLLTASMLLLIPFGLSLLLIFAFLHRHKKLLGIWIKAISVFSSVYLLGILASGIYLSVEGSVYMGYAAIAMSLIFSVYMGHSIFLFYKMFISLSDPVTRQA